jgi:LuxR family maltose regulon positive regulatory protein
MSTRFSLKLAAPTNAPVLIDRCQTLAPLEHALDTYQVVALAAPAGWGKTTALAQWVTRSGLLTAWYTLDPTDRDPHLFLDYLLHAVHPFVPRSDDLLAQLANLPPGRLPELFRAAALAIAECQSDFTLVLDDFHVLEEDAGAALPGTALVFDFLATLVAYAPRCRIVLASRTVPVLGGLARLVAQERATVFDYTMLQWTAADVQTLASQRYSLRLPDELAARLVSRMDGWVTGLVLSLSRAVQSSDLSALDLPVDATHLAAFFAEQIVAPLPADLQRFLEDTSVLDALSPQLCDQLRDRHDSLLFLDELRRRSLFITQRSGWLSYHSLFRDFLRSRLARDAQRERGLLQRAGDLYRADDQIERALECYLAARQNQQGLDLLREAVPRLRQHSRQTTLLACFERLVRVQPLPADLLLAQARVYSDLALWSQAELLLGRAEAVGDDNTVWDARILSARILILKGDLDLARTALAEVPHAQIAPDIQLRYYIAMGQLSGLSGEVRAALASFEQALGLLPQISHLQHEASLQADLYDNLGWAYSIQGDMRLALRYLQRAEACWQAYGDQGRRALTLNNLGFVEIRQGRYSEARQVLETGLTIARGTMLRREETVLLLNMADLEIYEGQIEQALARFEDTYTLASRIDMANKRAGAAAGALFVSALLRRQPQARRWQALLAESDLERWPHLRGSALLAEAYLLLQQTRLDRERLAALLDDLAALGPNKHAYERLALLLLQASLAFAREGWAAALPLWKQFEGQQHEISPAMLQVLAQFHQPLIWAAAQHSALARELRGPDQQTAAQRWRVSALGDFSCTLDGRPCQIAPLYRSLLLRLLDAGPGGMAVDRLWEDVWGNDALSMSALHQALRRLRVQTQLDVAARDGMCAIWTPWDQIRYDVQELEDLLRRRPGPELVDQVMELYRGDFFQGAPLSAADWADRRRLQLQTSLLDYLELAASALEPHEPKRALHCYQRILQIDGCREEAATHLMQLAGHLGNHALVAATFKQLERNLSQIGIQPNQTTTTLYLQVQ